MFQFPMSKRRAQSCTEKKTLHYYRLKESVKFGWGTNWESFGTEKPYGPSVQRMVDGGWIPLGRRCKSGY